MPLPPLLSAPFPFRCFKRLAAAWFAVNAAALTAGGPFNTDGVCRCPPSWLGGGNGRGSYCCPSRSPVPPSDDYYLLGGSPALRRRASGQPHGASSGRLPWLLA